MPIGSLISGIFGMGAAKKQAQAERRAQEIEQRRANALAQKEKYQQMREARIARGRVIAGAQNAGAGAISTSGLSGATGAIQSQLGENIGTINQMQGFSNAVSLQNQIAAKQASKQQMWAGIGNIFSQITSAGTSYMGAKAGGGFSTTPFTQAKPTNPWGSSLGWEK
jgi:hypothetical protein